MRIGIVNDLPMAREALRRVVTSVAEHQVIWTAGDGAEAVVQARKDTPDVILMDLIMPRVDGVEATRQIMGQTPCAIIVVTATVSGHMNKVYEAMGHGALDAVDTPVLGRTGQVNGSAPLLEKLAVVGKLIGKSSAILIPPQTVTARPSTGKAPCELVLLGASTGGPKALADILTGLPASFPAAVIIVQHVDAAFAPSMAHWLSEHSRLPVQLVAEGQSPEPGRVLLAATNDHLVMKADRTLSYSVEPTANSFRPSLDVFYTSVAAYWGEPGIAALLTGMGRDGALGLLRLRNGGWYTIAQDERTCVIWGMPKAAAELGAASRILPIGQIAGAIARQLEINAALAGGHRPS